MANTVKFEITAEMDERWVPCFMSMLKYMEFLGELGSSREVTIYSDGDGSFRPHFKTDYEYEEREPVKEDARGNRVYDI